MSTVDRFTALGLDDLMMIASGRAVAEARRCANLDGVFIHPGDAMGRLAALAYRRFGAEGAGELLAEYYQTLSEIAPGLGVMLMGEEHFKDSAAMALDVELDAQQIEQIQQALWSEEVGRG